MKYRCTVSHEQPMEAGRFRRFEAGQEYEGEFEGDPNFEKVKEAAAKPVTATKIKGVVNDN